MRGEGYDQVSVVAERGIEDEVRVVGRRSGECVAGICNSFSGGKLVDGSKFELFGQDLMKVSVVV